MFLLEVGNLKEGFDQYFEVVPALTEDLRHEAYRVRHEVYCAELGFEQVRESHEEQDKFDGHSWHVLIRSKKLDRYVGCVRLVRPDPENPGAPLPFEALCSGAIDRAVADPAKLPRDRIIEVSRLAVVSDYRKRTGENKVPFAISVEDFGTPQQPRFPFIPVGLYMGMLAVAVVNDIEQMFTLTEPRLARHLTALGYKVRRIGSPVEHRGARIPSVIPVEENRADLPAFMRPFYQGLEDTMRAAFSA